MSSAGDELFGAIPLGAFRDRRLSAGDLRLLGVIAYFDRLGRNHMGCYARPEMLAEMAGIRPEHLARHTARLAEFGYIEIRRSATDRRKRVYSLIYNNNPAVVAKNGDNPAVQADAAGDTGEKVATNGDKVAEKVATSGDKATPQIDVKSLLVRQKSDRSLARRDSVKQNLKDPAKQGAQRIESAGPRQKAKPTPAWQGGALQAKMVSQKELRFFGDANQRNRNHQERRRSAEERLGNDLVARGLYEWLDDKRWPRWCEAYTRAIDAEMQRPGAGVRYLAGALKRATKEARAARNRMPKKTQLSGRATSSSIRPQNCIVLPVNCGESRRPTSGSRVSPTDSKC